MWAQGQANETYLAKSLCYEQRYFSFGDSSVVSEATASGAAVVVAPKETAELMASCQDRHDRHASKTHIKHTKQQDQRAC